MRALIKRGAERVLASPLVTRLTERRVRGQTLILAYHAISPRPAPLVGVGERALFVDESRFAAHLDMLASIADVVALHDIDAPPAARPRVAITFDDAYHGAVTVAVRELVARAMPATIFVAPGRLDGHVFWWDALAHERGALDDSVRSHALDALGGDDERVRAWARATNLPARDDLPAFARAASTAELRAAAAEPGITFGSHTWSHVNLARTDAAAFDVELARPLAWIRETFGDRAMPWIAYPYGLDSPGVHRAAAAAGYAAGLRITGGWHRAHTVSAFARPRLNVPSGLSTDGLRARVLGAIRT